MSDIQDFLKGQTIEPTKVVSDFSTALPTEIRLKNSKGYYYAILVVIVFLWVMFLKPNDGQLEIVGLFDKNKWLTVAITGFLTWGLGLMIYRLFIDNGDKLIIDSQGIRSNNLTTDVDVKWKDVKETNLYIGAKSTYKLLIKTNWDSDEEIFIANLNKSPREIGHFVELFRRHYAQQSAYASRG